MRARQAGCIQLQAARLLPVVLRPARGADDPLVDHVIPHVPVSQWVMSPRECTQRLAALVSRPSAAPDCFHGVLAPNAKLRAMVVPQEPVVPARAPKPAECEGTVRKALKKGDFAAHLQH